MSQTRRLAAILAADVAGYSRLIGADESGTLKRLAAIRAEVTDPRIAEHHGRIVKTMGDGLLVEFTSVVNALHCASEVQTAMAECNAAIATDDRIQFRIGINVGDVVVEDDVGDPGLLLDLLSARCNFGRDRAGLDDQVGAHTRHRLDHFCRIGRAHSTEDG